MNICVINGRKYRIEGKKLNLKNINGVITINGRPLSDYPSEEVGGANNVFSNNGGGIQIDSIKGGGNVVISNNSSDVKMPKEFHEAMDMLKNMFKK